MEKIIKEIVLDGQKMIFEFSDLAGQSNGSVLASLGETKVLVTVVMGEETTKNYLPLKVDYEERFYAAGEILGSKYMRREGRPGTEATLSARMIDRALRPFFDKNLTRDIHIVATVLSIGEYDPDILALNGASVALTVSDIPWEGPVGAVRLVRTNTKKVKFNPDYQFRTTDNYFDIVFSGPGGGKISMVEAESSEMSEGDFLEAVDMADQEISNLVAFFNQIRSEMGQEKVKVVNREKTPEETEALEKEKAEREDVRQNIMSKDTRADGRKLDEIRPLSAQAGRLSKSVHGTGIFYRGETHVLSVLTLGNLEDALFINGMEIQTEKNYIHHYNFPPYSVGEVGRLGSPGRREIGHGSLAEKALRRMLPSPEEFPYTMRVVSEVMSSNGSTSMAATCASTLALLSGGVPLKNKVAGIALGLVSEGEEYKILTDIMGMEDRYGDMDFKITGTDQGITAIQLDVKVHGLDKKILEESLERGKEARLKILDKINETISEPASMSDRVEKIETLSIPKNKIGLVIGKGGVTIKQITQESGAKVDIKRDGQTFIFGGADSIDKARQAIEKIIGHGDKN